MEDILASIRRIIVDDDDKAAVAQQPTESTSASDDDGDEDEDVLELTELADDEATSSQADSAAKTTILDITAGPDKPADEADRAHATDDDGWKFAEPMQPEIDRAEDTMAHTPDNKGDRLMSRDTATSAATSLSSLARASDPDPLHGVPQGRPVEELVMEALKPMMSEWLNEHLPAIVERIVEREVRYLSRRPQDD
jgi:cell pole-organizing protein PopZ